jgi:excisionase family DNA binding protein
MNLHDQERIHQDGMATEIEPMLTPEQVAKLLNVSKATVCRLTKRSEIPHKRLGGRIVRYSRAELEKWMLNS